MESKVEINDLRNALRKVPEAMDKELRVAFRDMDSSFVQR